MPWKITYITCLRYYKLLLFFSIESSLLTFLWIREQYLPVVDIHLIQRKFVAARQLF